MNIRLIPALMFLAFATLLHAQAKRPSSLLPPRPAPGGTGAAGVASPGDWPQFRGADRDDISKETGLLKKWPANDGPPRLWTNQDAGLGYSGFSVVAGTLYTMGANDDGEEYVIALDAATGKKKWSSTVGARLQNGWGDGPRSTPTVDGDRIYALGGRGNLVCMSAKDGKEIWKTSLMEDHGGKIQQWGFCESVLVKGDRVVCTPGGPKGTMLALDKMTGKRIWQTSDWTDECQYASILPVAHNGAGQLIQFTQKTLAGVDFNSGKVLWQTPFPGRTAVIPTPIFREGNVYVAAGYGIGCMMVNIGKDNSVTPVYQNTNMVNHHGGVILVGDHLYGFSDGSRSWTCQDFKSGEVVWAEKKLGKGAIHCADGMLYLLDEKSGDVVLIEASPKGWNESGRFTLSPLSEKRNPKGGIWPHPVVSNGKLYLRDQEYIYCFNVKA
jgi:outer membrane protein assembly factor BamB